MTDRTYLLVDDNEDFAENLAEILRDTGATVDVALRGELALDLVTGRRYDAVLTDMQLPGLCGAALVEALRRRDGGVPLVVLSGYAQSTELTEARRHGLLAVLSKPQPVPELLSLLNHARRDAVVAVVEDDEALADNLAESLRAHGLSAVVAKTLAELDALPVPPCCALVDLVVPGGAPGAALDHLAARYPGTPAVVISAHADLLPVEGAEASVPKPFDTRDLVGRVEALYEQRVPR